ncbi:MAG: hypothetical protein J2P45_18625 [Candidatus Dormibacteraeota bacterium]|nr:hypothetical protein [Candidatus Dormibacteraeota bacterium]
MQSQQPPGSQPATQAENTQPPARTRTFAPDGWVLFAGVMILFSGIFNAFDGFWALWRAHAFFGPVPAGPLRAYAWLWLGFALLLIIAGLGVLAGQPLARWFGIVVVGLNAFSHLLAVTSFPVWSVVLLVIDVMILYGLTVHWGRSVATEGGRPRPAG